MSARAGATRGLFLVVVIIGVSAATCDGNSDEDARSNGDGGIGGTPSSVGIDADRPAPAAPIHGATVGGVVTVTSSAGSETMDPTAAYATDTVSILSGLVTRSLTQYVYEPELATMVLIPDIATDIGTPNDDFTEWTYTIRPGVRFEDGTEVTAADVAFGIERSFDRETFPGGAPYSNEYFLDGDTYKGPYVSGTNYRGVVVDGHTLTLKMARPFPDMPYWAAFPAIGPIPQDGSRPEEYAGHPLATGPYKFADYQPDRALTLVRNDQWDPDTDPGRHQYPDEFRFDFHTPARLADAAILADSRDGRTSVRYFGVATADLRAALADAADLLTVGPTPCVTVMALDYRKITDLRVRQAIGYAYPYDDIVAANGGIVGVTSSPGRTILPPGTPGRVDYNPLSTDLGETDPEKAKDLLAKAGHPPGEYPIKFAFVQSDPVSVAVKNALAAGLEAGGFKVIAYATTAGKFWPRQADPTAPYNVRRGFWCSDWPTGAASLLPVMASSVTEFSPYLRDPAVDAQIEQIGRLPLADQPAAWSALDRTIETDYYPFVISRYDTPAMLHGSRIGGMYNDDSRGMPTWKDIYVIR